MTRALPPRSLPPVKVTPQTVRDQVAEVRYASHALIGLERLVMPTYPANSVRALLASSRAALGTALHTLNVDMLRQLEALEATAAELQGLEALWPKPGQLGGAEDPAGPQQPPSPT